VGEPSDEDRDELDDWLEVFHDDSLTLAAAGVIASRGTLREAAHRLHDAGSALFLAARARRVYLLIRGADLAKSMSTYLVERITDAGNVELLANTEVEELLGEDRLEGIVVEDNRSGARRALGARALFAFIGADANTGWLRGAVDLDERGFVLTGTELGDSALAEDPWRALAREPFLLESSLPGVFAAGDARSGSTKRCASAVGEGAMAVRLVHQYLADAGVHKA